MTDYALIEAMARAMCEVGELDPDDWWECLRSDAKAALAAIRKTHAVVLKTEVEEQRRLVERLRDEKAAWVAKYERAMLAASEEPSDA